MKKFAITTAVSALACALLAASLPTQAQQYQFNPGDSSDLSKFCVAALQAPKDIVAVAKQFGFSAQDLDTIRCNDKPVSRLVAKYNYVKSNAASTVVFNKSDNSDLTNLCMAAITSEADFERLKARLFESDPGLQNEIRCNGTSLQRFVKRYHNRPAETLSSAAR
jgi:hypothetical protein